MTATEALDKIRVMLGLEQVESTTEVETKTETTTIELAEATLLDGTIVKTEGEFATLALTDASTDLVCIVGIGGNTALVSSAKDCKA